MKSVPLSDFMADSDGAEGEAEDRGHVVDSSPTPAQDGARKWENVPKRLDLAEWISPAAQAEWAVGDTPPTLPPQDGRWEARRTGPPANGASREQGCNATGSCLKAAAGPARR